MRIFSLITVVFSIALLIFLCIYPANRTKIIVDEIVALADECLDAIKNNNTSILDEKITRINDILESEAEIMKMFYFHADIGNLENAAHRTKKILDIMHDDTELLISSICDIREYAEQITERDGIGWGSFI